MHPRKPFSKNLLTLFVKIALAGMLALTVLSAICLVFSASGIHIHNDSGATDYKWQPNQWKSTIFEGFAWFTMDENGFNNQVCTQEAPDVLLMGSSHMEAVNVPADKNVASIMNTSSELRVYNIGTSGHTIYTCVKNMEAAVDEYCPTQYLVLETDTVDLSISKMQSVLDGQFPTIPSYDSGALYLMQKYVPALKAIYKNMMDWKDADNHSEASPKTEEDGDYESVLELFLGKASSSATKDGAKFLIFYHPSAKIDENGAYLRTTDETKLAIFKKHCEALDIVFVDMTEAFETLYEQEHILPKGFSNTAVGSGHLNREGHRIIAETLIKTIEEIR